MIQLSKLPRPEIQYIDIKDSDFYVVTFPIIGKDLSFALVRHPGENHLLQTTFGEDSERRGEFEKLLKIYKVPYETEIVPCGIKYITSFNSFRFKMYL